MADNYLERQREQYEARKAAWEKAKKLGKKKIKPAVKSQSQSTNKPRLQLKVFICFIRTGIAAQ